MLVVLVIFRGRGSICGHSANKIEEREETTIIHGQEHL